MEPRSANGSANAKAKAKAKEDLEILPAVSHQTIKGESDPTADLRGTCVHTIMCAHDLIN
eukprot:SAG31_NODE_46180_length_255_cov_1.070513_1_plen_60_part_10